MKRLIGTLLSMAFILVIGVILTITYLNFQPKSQEEISLTTNTLSLEEIDINFKNLEETLLNNEETYYLWFCDSDDDNCNYVENEYITKILNKLNIDKFENIYKVNFTNCNYSKQRLLQKYNVDSTLAFVKAEVKNGEISYTDSITWTKDQSFTFEQLQEWLYNHNIWQTAYKTSSKKSD